MNDRTRRIIPFYQRMTPLNGRNSSSTMFEALGRIEDEGTILEPCAFLKCLTEGSYRTLDHAIAAQALAQVATWGCAGKNDVHMHVNASEHSLTDPGYASRIHALLDECGVKPYQLTVEITEECTFFRSDRVLRTLEDLSVLGVGLAIDDFPVMEDPLGTIAWLNANRGVVQTLKFDKYFVQAACTKAGKHLAELMRYTTIGHALNMVVVAEGVERPDELALLERLHVDYAQGFVHGRPRPAHEIDLWPVTAGERLSA